MLSVHAFFIQTYCTCSISICLFVVFLLHSDFHFLWTLLITVASIIQWSLYQSLCMHLMITLFWYVNLSFTSFSSVFSWTHEIEMLNSMYTNPAAWLVLVHYNKAVLWITIPISSWLHSFFYNSMAIHLYSSDSFLPLSNLQNTKISICRTDHAIVTWSILVPLKLVL